MKRKQKTKLALLLAFPAAVLLLCVIYETWLAWNEGIWFDGFPSLLAIAGAGVSVFAAVLGLYITFHEKKTRPALVESNNEEEPISDKLKKKLTRQSKEIELLAAMREVGLITAREVEFEKILEAVLEVVEGAFLSNSITVFLVETSPHENKDGAGLIPKAHRQGGKSYFTSKLPATLPLKSAKKAFRKRFPVCEKFPDRLECALPLVADQNLLGVFHINVPFHSGSLEEADEIEKKVERLTRHIALAIKTPILYDRAVVDGLTRLYTKRHFTEQFATLFEQSARTVRPLGLIMIDIDYFKKINDTHGHLSGDIILAGVAEIVKNSTRKYDTAYRYGGEEMSVVLPEADVSKALRVARRIRKSVEENEFISDSGEVVPVTVSCGVASFRDGMKSPQDLISSADEALYKAKETGRNKVVAAKKDKKEKTAK